MIACRVTILGHVQGVGFRWHTMLAAQQLGVLGWVRNAADGSVETHLEGDPKAVESLLDWLAAGPSPAVVTGVDVTAATLIHAETFEVTY